MTTARPQNIEQFPTSLLVGDTAVVTGAASGIGRVLAFGLARAGAAVAVVDIDGSGAAAVADELRGEGATAFSSALDVRDLAACQAVAKGAGRSLGPISILVNSAGILRKTALEAESFDADYRATMGVNVDGTLNMSRAVMPQLRETRGRIVNVASVASFKASPGNVAYPTSKGAVLQLTRALACELALDGIRVNAIAPAVIETPMMSARLEDPTFRARHLSRTPLGRIGQPADLVGPVLFLASAMSSFVTGAALPVDGGFLSV